MTTRTMEGMAPYPGQARCLALGFWPECFRRLDVQGGQRPFPKETRSALEIEGKHVTIQGPSPDLSLAGPIAPSIGCQDLQIRRYLRGRPEPFRSVLDLGRLTPSCPVKYGEAPKSFVRVAPSMAPTRQDLSAPSTFPPLPPIGLTAAGLFAEGKVSRADSRVR